MKVSLNIEKTKKFQELCSLRTNTMIAALQGNYKEFKTSKQAYAKLAIENTDLLPRLPKQQSVSAPLFSIAGLRMLKVFLLDKFRCKTNAEKELAKFNQAEKIKQKINIQG